MAARRRDDDVTDVDVADGVAHIGNIKTNGMVPSDTCLHIDVMSVMCPVAKAHTGKTMQTQTVPTNKCPHVEMHVPLFVFFVV